MDKVKETLLADFKRSNKVRKLKLAQKYGFDTSDEYLNYLNGKSVTSAKEPSKEVIIHNVTLLDASGSMSGGKYNNSTRGIEDELKWLATQTDVTYTSTIREFIQLGYGVTQAVETNEVCFMQPAEKTRLNFKGARGGNTPLYKAVLDLIEDIEAKVNTGDKVLIKIYTDGQNNSLPQYLEECASKIKEVQKKGFTITFVGTRRDLNGIIKALGVDESNCLEVDDSGEGFKQAFEASRGATICYTANVVAGEDVSLGFYKKIIK